MDGIFHSTTYLFVTTGLFLLWRASQRPHFYWSAKLLIGTMLMGFGAFNVVEGLVDHHLLGIHHVNELVDARYRIYWDIGFILWGAAMLANDRCRGARGAGLTLHHGRARGSEVRGVPHAAETRRMSCLSVEARYATQPGTHHEASPWSASRIRPGGPRGKGGSARQTHDDEPLHFAEENKNAGRECFRMD